MPSNCVIYLRYCYDETEACETEVSKDAAQSTDTDKAVLRVLAGVCPYSRSSRSCICSWNSALEPFEGLGQTISYHRTLCDLPLIFV
jgi:hypothetical protein